MNEPDSSVCIGTVIERIQADMAAKKVVQAMASDEDVAKKIRAMSIEHGYVPYHQDVEPIRAYLSGYGVLLTGESGIGKTFLMRSLGSRMRPVDGIAAYGLRDIEMWYSWTDGTECCIDDLGTEHVISEYGAKEDLMKLVIAHRAERQTGRTSVTTNLTARQIGERYGDRTLSRLLGMCKAFALEGENRRTVDTLQREMVGA